MKVYTKLVLNWDGEVLEEESFDYSGPVALCGGSSGGGGSSGTVDYPDYMKDAHKRLLTAMEAALPAPNPFVNVNAPAVTTLTENKAIETLEQYLASRKTAIESITMSPSLNITHMQDTVFGLVASTVSTTLGYLNVAYQAVFPDELVRTAVLLDDRLSEIQGLVDVEGSFDLESEIHPRFAAGMRSINAVQMSTFVLGRGTIEGTYLAKFASQREQMKNEILKLRIELNSQITSAKLDVTKTNHAWFAGVIGAVGNLLQVGSSSAASMDTIRSQALVALENLKLEVIKLRTNALSQFDAMMDSAAGKSIEFSRMSLVALVEQSNVNIDYDEKQYRWDLENYQYLGNMLAAIGSGTVTPGGRQTSKFSSALGGALSGASAGAMVSGGNPIGAAIGGVIGLGAGLLS